MAEIQGPVRTARNFLTGGLHAPEEAARYGFPAGGAIGGNMHMDRFAPVLAGCFGDDWFVRGSVSVYFEQAVGEGTRIQVVVDTDGEQGAVRLRRVEDDATVGAGTAGLSSGEDTALRQRDLRPSDPADLQAFAGLVPGQVMADELRTLSSEAQLEQLGRGEIDDAPECWSSAEPWGGIVACPSQFVQLLNLNAGGSPAATWARTHAPGGATMFGAIEQAYVDGPVLLDEPYRVVSTVAAVGQSPRTEYCWWDSTIERPNGDLVATARALTRMFKPQPPSA
jgi:hypothetical protein